MLYMIRPSRVSLCESFKTDFRRERFLFCLSHPWKKKIRLCYDLNVLHGSLILNIASKNIRLVERFFSLDILESALTKTQNKYKWSDRLSVSGVYSTLITSPFVCMKSFETLLEIFQVHQALQSLQISTSITMPSKWRGKLRPLGKILQSQDTSYKYRKNKTSSKSGKISNLARRAIILFWEIWAKEWVMAYVCTLIMWLEKATCRRKNKWKRP